MSEIAELAEKLKAEGGRMHEFFSGLNDAEWATEVYADDNLWSVREVLAHLVTAERSLVKLFEEIRLGGVGSSEDFSIDRYNAAQQKRSKDLARNELLDQYRAVRESSVSWVNGLDEANLEIVGRHPFLGSTTIREMIKMLYIHSQTHFRDIRRSFSTGQSD